MRDISHRNKSSLWFHYRKWGKQTGNRYLLSWLTLHPASLHPVAMCLSSHQWDLKVGESCFWESFCFLPKGPGKRQGHADMTLSSPSCLECLGWGSCIATVRGRTQENWLLNVQDPACCMARPKKKKNLGAR